MAKIISTNPARNYEKLGEIEISSKDEIRDKVAQARAAEEAWKNLGVKGRISLLRGLVPKIQESKEKLAFLATKEMGMPISHK